MEKEKSAEIGTSYLVFLMDYIEKLVERLRHFIANLVL